MAKTADEYKMVSVLVDALNRIADECGCTVDSVTMSDTRADVCFTFQDVPHRMTIQKLQPVGPGDERPEEAAGE
jgi:hypothetical protein